LIGIEWIELKQIQLVAPNIAEIKKENDCRIVANSNKEELDQEFQ